MTVSVFGYITGHTNADEDTHNQTQLLHLPKTGALLIAELFSFVPYSRTHANSGSHIHFAAGYKEQYCLTDDWVDEFESLLSRLYWSDAELILTWSWERYDYSLNNQNENPSNIISRARFESAWNSKEIPWNLDA